MTDFGIQNYLKPMSYKLELDFNQENKVTLFIIAFGHPKPLHRIITQHWGQHDLVNFVVFTDKYDDWHILCQNFKNIHLISISVNEFFTSFCAILNCSSIDEFDKAYGIALYRNPAKPMEFRSWSTCALRPLLGSLYNIKSTWWGWVDYDVFIDKKYLKDRLAQQDLDAIYYMPLYHPPWEQLKIFNIRCQTQMHNLYMQLIKSFCDSRDFGKILTPLDAAFSKDFRKEKNLKFDFFDSFKDISVHWEYMNHKDWPGNDIKTDVVLDHVNAFLYTNYNQILFFIADTETKLFSDQKVDYILNSLNKYEFRFADQYDSK